MMYKGAQFLDIGIVYCPYIPTMSMMTYNGIVICWDGDMFPEFIREYCRRDTTWKESTILSATEDYRIDNKKGRDQLIDTIWQFVNDSDKYQKTHSYIMWMSEVSEQYREYQRSKIVGDCKLEEVCSI